MFKKSKYLLHKCRYNYSINKENYKTCIHEEETFIKNTEINEKKMIMNVQ